MTIATKSSKTSKSKSASKTILNKDVKSVTEKSWISVDEINDAKIDA